MVDYKNSVIYKLCCDDTDIQDIYVGSTTNFTLRKSQHKSMCCNANSKKHNLNVYQFIRNNGGWTNWDMIEIERYTAIDKRDLHKRERYWIENLGATLNKRVPSRTQKESGKLYYQDNREKIKEYQNAKIKCECGEMTTKSVIARHRKTMNHIKNFILI